MFVALLTALCTSFVFAIPLDQSNKQVAILEGTQFESRAVPTWQYYFDVNGAGHQSRFNQFASQGYRLISLSTYGASTDARYAAVWVQRPGPVQQAIHGVNGADYQTWFDRWTAQGYVPVLVSATGARNSAVYSGVMEQVSGFSWFQRCDMDFASFRNAAMQAYSQRQIMKSFREYGTPGDRRYCALYHANPTINHWDWSATLKPDDYQATVNAYVQNQFWRPASVSVSEDLQITALFMDTSVGSWVARHALTGSQLQAEQQRQASAGRYLINLCGGGVGSNTRFTAIFAEQDIPANRVWTAVGRTSGFKNNAASMATVDGIMKSFMQANGVRQAQISIGRNGGVLMERAYTWAEPNRHVTQTNDNFLLASVSKMFVAAAVQSLYNSGRLQPSTKVYPRLGYTNPRDPRVNDITVQQLIEHSGGYDRQLSGDPVFMMRQIALDQSTGGNPVTMKNIVDWAFNRNLDFAPGSRSEYSNYGYILLAYLVQTVSGNSYYDYLRTSFFSPEGLDVRQWPTAASAHGGDVIIQEASGIGFNALTPNSNVQVPSIYGGDGMVKEAAVGPSSLSASASTVTKFISKHAVRGNGPRRVSDHDGKMNGVRAWAQSRSDNVDWALNLNTMEFSTGTLDNGLFNTLCGTTINNFLNTNPIA